MRPPRYVPEAGDIVWFDFDPQVGHEQAGRRPALVLTQASYNGLIGLVICCPITTKIKGFPFEVRLAGSPASVILADQVKSQDWRVRRAQFKGRASAAEVAAVRAKLAILIT